MSRETVPDFEFLSDGDLEDELLDDLAEAPHPLDVSALLLDDDDRQPVEAWLRQAEQRGLVSQEQDGSWGLTVAGYRAHARRRQTQDYITVGLRARGAPHRPLAALRDWARAALRRR